MKKIFAVLTVFSLFCATAFAQEKSAPVAVGEVVDVALEGGPVMDFEVTEVDYGVIEQNSDPLRVFDFSNTGDAPLVIKHAKGSCGCTVPSYPKEPILPGESGQIEVRYDTKRIGKFTKRVTLTTNEGGEKKVLTIKGEVLKAPAEPAGVPETTPNLFNPNK